MEKLAATISPSTTLSALEEHVVKKSRQVGRILMPLLRAYVKWDQQLVMRLSMIIGVGGTSTKLLDFVRLFLSTSTTCHSLIPADIQVPYLLSAFRPHS